MGLLDSRKKAQAPPKSFALIVLFGGA